MFNNDFLFKNLFIPAKSQLKFIFREAVIYKTKSKDLSASKQIITFVGFCCIMMC